MAELKSGAPAPVRLNSSNKKEGGYLFGADTPVVKNKGSCKQPGCERTADLSDFCFTHYYFNQSLAIEEEERNRKKEADSAKAEKSKADLAAAKDKSIRITEEFVATEKTYLKGLKTVVRGFIAYLQTLDQLNTPLMSAEQIKKIFQNLPDIFSLHARMYADLKALRTTPLPGSALTPGGGAVAGGYPAVLGQLGAVLTRYSPFFRMYTVYCNEYETAIKLLADLRKDDPKGLGAWCALHERVEKCDMASLMITPIQRIPRYLLLLTELLKNIDTKTDPTSVRELEVALGHIKKVALDINDQMHMKERRLKVAAWEKRISRDGQYEHFTLVTPTRVHVREGVLAKKYNSNKHLSAYKDYYFILFNDCLIYTSVPSSPTSRVSLHTVFELWSCNLTIADAPADSTRKFGFEIITNVKSFKVCAADQKEKDEWLSDLKKCVIETAQNMNSLDLTGAKEAAAAQAAAAKAQAEREALAAVASAAPQPQGGAGPPPSPTGHSILHSAPPSPSAGGGGGGGGSAPNTPKPPAGTIQSNRPAPAPPGGLVPKPPGGPPPPGTLVVGAPPPSAKPHATVTKAASAAQLNTTATDAAPPVPVRPKKKG